MVLLPAMDMVRISGLVNFIDHNLPQYTQPQTSTNIVGKVPTMDQRPVQESQYNCTLIACAK